MNLTSITSDEDFTIKHFIDSLTLLEWFDGIFGIYQSGEKNGASEKIKRNKVKAIDIGTGAGFPGVPLKVIIPDMELTLLDSTLKKIVFLRETVEKLGLKKVACVHARAEEYRLVGNNDDYDVCMLRAVTNLRKAAGFALPLLKRGGRLLAMKGPDAKDELYAAKAELTKYGGTVADIKKFEIAKGMTHTVIVVEKGKPNV